MQTLDIIIPAFNAELRLERTLEAVFAQTVPAGIELGVIVVNNGSTDGTPGLIEKWADKKVRRVDYDAGQGRAPTINAGAAASTADYLLILDADCQLHGTDCLELIAAEMVQNVGAAFGYVTGTAENFWAKYQRRLETDRLAAGWQGWTTPCCAMRLSGKNFFRLLAAFRPTTRTMGSRTAISYAGSDHTTVPVNSNRCPNYAPFTMTTRTRRKYSRKCTSQGATAAASSSTTMPTLTGLLPTLLSTSTRRRQL
jgi:glycosyltransferase involved in cell wall biosynthesis